MPSNDEQESQDSLNQMFHSSTSHLACSVPQHEVTTLGKEDPLNAWYSASMLRYSESMDPFAFSPKMSTPLPSPIHSMDQQMFQYSMMDNYNVTSQASPNRYSQVMANSMSPMGSPFYYSSPSSVGKFSPQLPMYRSDMTHFLKHENSMAFFPSSPPMTPYLNEHPDLGQMSMPPAGNAPKSKPRRRESVASVSSNGSKSEKEKPFKCPHPGCDARFPRMYNLKSHILCHTGDRPHVCPLSCGAAFARKHDLQRHMRTLHSPHRPFQCPYPKCAHAFRRANSFWRHLVEEHPETSSEHAEIYQSAVQAHQNSQKAAQEAQVAQETQAIQIASKNAQLVMNEAAHAAMNPDLMLMQPVSASPAIPMDIPRAANVSNEHSHSVLVDDIFSNIPKFNEIYRGHFSI